MNNRIPSSHGSEPSLGDDEAWEDVSSSSDNESNEAQRWQDMEQVWEDLSSEPGAVPPPNDRAHARPQSGSGGDSGRKGPAKPKDEEGKPEFSVALQPGPASGIAPPLQSSEQGLLGEQIRKLRTELLLRHGHRNAATLGFVVVSTLPGEGRSLMAAELAMSFARLGRSTLLVDADLRNPAQHRRFGIELGGGLVQSIVEGDPPELHSIKNIPGLSLITAGSNQDFDPSELLSNARFKRLMDSLQNIFEFIIVDTPPFTLYPDAQVVSAVVGRVMTLHRSASSNYKDTRSMLRTLAISDAEVIGGVLNSF